MSWTRQGTVHVEVATVHREDPLHFVSPESLTGSADPDFTVGPSVPFPSWLAVISDVSGRWRTVPFHEGPRVSVVAVEASRVSGRVVESYASPSRKIRYRFRRGTFEPLRRREPAAPCNPHLFGLLARPPIRVARAACAYGWALAAGKRKGRSVVAGFEELGTSWSWLETVRARQIDSFEYIDGMPEWLLKRLARRVGASG